MPAPTAAELAEAYLLVQAYAAAQEQARDEAAAAAEAAWLAFAAWYSTDQVAALAAEMAEISRAAQDIAIGAVEQYVSLVGQMAGGSPTFGRRPVAPEIRGGTDLRLVHRRPAQTYRRAVAMGADREEAFRNAAIRATGLMRSDTALAERAAAHLQLERMGITQFRRILHPELSRTGSCGLCIAAADNVYSTGDLMPIHPPHCKCTVMPVVGEWDPAVELNAGDIASYADVAELAGATGPRGGTTRRDLASVRYHAEYGPYLTNDNHRFRGSDRVNLSDDPERAARWLQNALPVLRAMEAGEKDASADELDFQRRFVSRLQEIAA
jgi:hypothetical protein